MIFKSFITEKQIKHSVSFKQDVQSVRYTIAKRCLNWFIFESTKRRDIGAGLIMLVGFIYWVDYSRYGNIGEKLPENSRGERCRKPWFHRPLCLFFDTFHLPTPLRGVVLSVPFGDVGWVWIYGKARIRRRRIVSLRSMPTGGKGAQRPRAVGHVD